MPAVSMALHDDAVGTIFEKRPICTFSAAAMPDGPPAIEDVEALRLGAFEPKKPTIGGKNFECFATIYDFSTCQCLVNIYCVSI